MKRHLAVLSLLAAFALHTTAAVPPAPKLLPADTLALVTVPDWSRTLSGFKGSPGGALWSDPAMKPFRDQFERKFVEKFLAGIEKDLGIKSADFLPLLQGQLTVAVLQNGWKGDDGTLPGWVVVIDAKDHAPDLKKQLGEIRTKLADAKKPVKTEKIRDLDFLSVSVDMPDQDDGDADSDAKKKTRKMDIVFGQADTALVVGDSVKGVEKLVARLTGGTVPTIGEDASFQASEAAWFKQAHTYGWIHWSPIYAVLSRQAKDSEGADAMGVDPKAAMKAVGLEGLKTVSIAATLNAEGSGFDLSLSVPEAQRIGLFRMLAPVAKDSSPTPFVPADAIRFSRWRIDGQKLWASLEQTLASISPQLAGFAQMMISTAGKDKDPNFDLKKQVVGNLGDDLITYSKAPVGDTPQELMNPPSLTLVGSSNAEGLAAGLRGAGGLLPGTGEESAEREFNGKKIRAIRLPAEPGQKARKMEFAASGAYVSIGTAPALLEEYLRSAEGNGKSLRDDPAIGQAAEKVGGMGSGYFGYENQRGAMRGQWEFMRGGGLDKLLDQTGARSDWREVFDFKSLPPYERIARYFGIAVYSGSSDAQGLNLRFYGPKPR
jgi:hypothetical protein